MDRIPAPLLRHIFGPPLIGAGCLFIGCCSRDRLTLILGALIAVFCLGRAATAYRRVKRERYTTVTGTCVAVQAVWPLRLRRVTIMTDDGETRTFYLERCFKPRVGHRVKLFFWKCEGPEQNAVNAYQMVETLRVIGLEEIE